MIGTTIVLGQGASKAKGLNTLKEAWHERESLLNEDDLNVGFISYDGYPIKSWAYNSILIVFEGIVYNIEDNVLKNTISSIIDSNYEKTEILNLIKNADGDFCVYIIDKDNKEVIAFNDILGGLPLFYCNNKNTFYISRQFGLIASNIKEKAWNNAHIAEFLSFGHNLKTRTFSDKVFKLEPASYVHAKYDNEIINCQYLNLYVDDFKVHNGYNSKREAVKDLVRLFEESCSRRVDYAKKNGYRIVNTISGGFDSRTVVGGLEKCECDYTNLTYEYLQDESATAKAVCKAVGSKSEYVKLSFKNEPDLYDSRLSINTDGRINSYTNSICYHDMLSVREYFGNERILYFGGFGGEFIRHPKFETLLPFNDLGMAYTPSFILSSKVCCTEGKVLKGLFSKSFDGCVTRESKYKDLYNEYYQNLVRCSGEDRTRMFYFTVQPMMGKDFIMAIRHRIPLKWVGFEFYKMFLKELDPRLLSVGIFGKSEDYLEDKNLKRLDSKKKVKEYYLSVIRYFLQKYKRRELNNKEDSIDYKDIIDVLEEQSKLGVFDVQYIKNNYRSFSKSFKYQLISTLYYINSFKD